MLGVSTAQLAAAVTNAGGLGAIAITGKSVADARALIHETRKLTNGSFNVNMFCHDPIPRDSAKEEAWIEHFKPLFNILRKQPPSSLKNVYPSVKEDPSLLEMVIEEKPAVVSFHFGVPSQKWIQKLHDSGILVFATVTNMLEACAAQASGVDGIVAQGIEAGGHRGVFNLNARDEKYPTSVLVRLLSQTVTIPVIAAGGIMDGTQIRAFLDMGCVAVQMGTAFIACPESSATKTHRRDLQSPASYETVLTSSVSGRPARGIKNKIIEWGEKGEFAPYPYAYDVVKQVASLAAAQGYNEFNVEWAGQGAPLSREMEADVLVRVLAKEAGFDAEVQELYQ